MDTDKLIGDLSRDLKPVTVLPPPARRAARFAIFALLIVFLFIVVAGVREDAAVMMASPRFIFENAAMFFSGVLAAFAAFHLSVPDTRIRKPVLVAILLAVSGWIILALLCCGDLDAGHGHHEMGWHCIRDLAALVVAPIVAAFILLGKGAPVWRGWAGFGMLLSVASFCGIGMRFLCPNDNGGHLLLLHYLPVMVISVIGIFMGRFLLHFKNTRLQQNQKTENKK